MIIDGKTGAVIETEESVAKKKPRVDDPVKAMVNAGLALLAMFIRNATTPVLKSAPRKRRIRRARP